jgi:hypothetical protein
LHDDFNGINKDVYVENLGDSPVYVRVKMAEYLQIGNSSLLISYTDENEKGDPLDVTTWAMHTWTTATDTVCTNEAATCHSYYAWTLGTEDTEQKYYLSGITESDSDGHGGLSEEEFNDLAENAKVTIGTVTTYKRATAVSSNPMMLSEYLEILQKDENDLDEDDKEILNTARWLLDTDGWAYWSQPLQPNKATNLLLDAVEPIDTTHPYDNWVYNIDVQLQAASPNQMTSWYRDNVDAASIPAVQVIDIDTDAAQNITDPNAIANPDNSIMTATFAGVEYINIKAEDRNHAG